MSPHWFWQQGARRWSCPAAAGDVEAFHRGLPGYAPTPLVELPTLAAELGVGRVFVKDESQRFDLRAFKFLGASWATARALAARASRVDEPPGLDGLRDLVAADPALLVTATDGNHGRAVARMARLVGASAWVVVPDVVPADALDRIAAEGARVETVTGSYDDAVAQAARQADADPSGLLVQDTAWPGYATVPQWIVDGYATLVREVDAQLAGAGVQGPDLVVVPAGVGSLAQAVVAHYRSGRHRPAVLAVEPDSAACVVASLHAGRPTSVPTAATVMAGLNCGTVSMLAWPVLSGGLDAAVAVDDEAASAAVLDLDTLGVSSGPSGAATLAGARAALLGAGADRRRDALEPLGAAGPAIEDAVVVLLSTEGRHR